ncbi:winged helix-turn-helix domain-containing protein [Rhizobium sp. BK251]|uniref:winged helix-turn-helix domain-containing protein n=1 Tax=Rhizobium sp. BK251 TaxID=2512125 RepID=UPI001405424F|nr:winged helix-turn-helix domain-containing protein [Rhizobium sp. BK251]
MEQILYFGPFRLNGAERLLLRDEEPVAIGGRGLDILIALIERAGEVVSKRELIDLVWPDVTVEEANLRVHITILRRVLQDGQDGARYVVNIPGRGYSFVASVHRSDLPAPPKLASPGPSRVQSQHELRHRMVGRSDDVFDLSSLLLARRFVSVVGAGGVGKTTVAAAVADALFGVLGRDGVYFVDFGVLDDPTLVPHTVAAALGCLIPGSDPDLCIRTALAERRVLLVLDSCEHVVETVARFTERLFLDAPSVHLLATSREALHVGGENVYRLAPLETPAEEFPTAGEALASPAVQLFMERATASGYRHELSDKDAPFVASICRRLDGIALAIELAASRVGLYGIQGTAELLDHGGELVLDGRRGALPRHQSLQATLDWSYNLLSSQEQRILCRLSVFAEPFTLEAAHAMARDAGEGAQAVSNALASLIDKSLLSVFKESVSAVYRLPDTTRAYAAAKLVESNDLPAISRNDGSHFAILNEAAGKSGSAVALRKSSCRHQRAMA